MPEGNSNHSLHGGPGCEPPVRADPFVVGAANEDIATACITMTVAFLLGKFVINHHIMDCSNAGIEKQPIQAPMRSPQSYKPNIYPII